MQHCARPNRRRLQNACRQSGVPGWERWNSTKQRDVSRLWNRGNRSKPSMFKSQNQKPVVALNGDQVDNLRRAKIQTRLYIHTDIKSWDKNCSVGEQKWPTTCIRQRKQILSSMYLDQIRLQRWLGPWSHPERNQQQCGPGTWATLNCWEREPKKWILGCWDKGFGHLSYNIVPVWLYLSVFSCSSLMICCPTKRL